MSPGELRALEAGQRGVLVDDLVATGGAPSLAAIGVKTHALMDFPGH